MWAIQNYQVAFCVEMTTANGSQGNNHNLLSLKRKDWTFDLDVSFLTCWVSAQESELSMGKLALQQKVKLS